MKNFIKKPSFALAIFLSILFFSCNEGKSEEPRYSSTETKNSVDNDDFVGKAQADKNFVETVETVEYVEDVEENEKVEKAKDKRFKELELLKIFKEKQNKTITDEFGLVQNYTVDKEVGEYHFLGSTGEIRYTYEENGWQKWDSYELNMAVREVTYNLKKNGELLHQVKTFEQAYEVMHQYDWGTDPSQGTGAFLTFEPDLESIDKRKEIYTEISRRFVFHRDGESQATWAKAYSDLIKNSGVLDLNSYNDFNNFINSKTAPGI